MRRDVRAVLWFFGSCASFALLPTSLPAQSFDCSKASTRTEKMICADPEIAKLDTQMAERYKLLLSKETGDRNGAVAVQVRWLAETRNVAALPVALKQAYILRLEALDGALSCHTSDDLEWIAIRYCAQVSFSNSDAELAAQYRKLLSQLDPVGEREEVAILKASQDAWLKFRDAHCEWETVNMRGGNMQPMVIAGCAQSLNKERLKQLAELPQ